MSLDDDDLKIVPERDNISSEKRPKASKGKSSHSMANIALWFCVCLLVVAAGGLFTQNQQLNTALQGYQSKLETQSKLMTAQQANLSVMDERIQSLESQLAATGRDLSQSGSSLEKRIEEAGSSLEKRINASEHEIRKLWDLSNKRNKADIAENSQQLKVAIDDIASLKKSLIEQQQGFAKQKQQLSEQLAVLEKSDKALEALQKSLQSGQAQLVSDQKELTQMQAKQQLQLEQVASEGKSLSNIDEAQKKVIADLGGKLKQLEQHSAQLKQQGEKLKQVDALNNQLVGLEKKLAQLGNMDQTEMRILLEEHNERLDAVDASRRQFISSVTRLTTDVNQLRLELGQLKAASQ